MRLLESERHRIFVARHKDSDETRTIKIIRHSAIDSNYRDQLVEVLNFLKHHRFDGIAQVYESIILPSKELVLIMEFCEGVTLEQMLKTTIQSALLK